MMKTIKKQSGWFVRRQEILEQVQVTDEALGSIDGASALLANWITENAGSLTTQDIGVLLKVSIALHEAEAERAWAGKSY